MRAGAATALCVLTCAACGGDARKDRVETQVEQRFGAGAVAECEKGSDDRSWLCDIFVESEQRNHEGCRAFVDADLRVVRFDSC